MKNNWRYLSTKKHEHWIYEIEELDIASIVIINSHVTKGVGVQTYTLDHISEKMKISRNNLVKAIRENKKFSKEELISFHNLRNI